MDINTPVGGENEARLSLQLDDSVQKSVTEARPVKSRGPYKKYTAYQIEIAIGFSGRNR